MDRALEVVLPALRCALEERRATDPGVLRGLYDGTPVGAARLVGLLMPAHTDEERDEAATDMVALHALAVTESDRRRRGYAHLEFAEVLLGVMAGREAKRIRLVQAAAAETVRAAEAAWKPAVRPGRYRTRRSAQVAALAGPTARADAESAARARWKGELAALILEAGGPLVDATSSAADQRAALGLAAGGRRAATLEKRVRVWRRVRAWCLGMYGRPYPSGASQALDYAQARIDEPCGLSTLQALSSTYAFMETCCGAQRGQRFTDSAQYQEFMREMEAGLTGGDGKAVRRAPRFPLCIVAGLEREVVDGNAPRYFRAYAWWILLSAWASLRFDDSRGLAPASVTLTLRGLEAELVRTKTTGPGKAVPVVPVIVAYGAYLCRADWLVVGWRLWQEMAPMVRDHLLLSPAADLDGVGNSELRYDESARLLRGLLAGLVRDGEACGAVMEQYLALFTQHSGRCWLPSLAALLDASSSDLDYLGRWRPTTAKTYVRTALQVVARMQVRVAERVRHELADGQAELLGESAAYLELRRELLRRGNDLRQIEQQEGLFRAWTAKVLYPPAQGAEAPAWEEDELDLEAADEASDATPIDFEPARGPEEHRAPEERGRGAGGEQLPVEEPAEAQGSPAEVLVPDEGIPADGYVVSISKKKWRRLHRIGGCTRHPGVHYLEYELLGRARPTIDMYDDYCRQCWREGSTPDEDTDEVETDSGDEESDAPEPPPPPGVALGGAEAAGGMGAAAAGHSGQLPDLW